MRRPNREKRGLGKPETFNFLGFTFICGKSRRGNFLLKRKTRRDRMRAKLQEIKEELRRRMHQPIPEQGQWLKQVVAGFFNYHAVPTNSRALAAFRYHVIDLWRRTLRRRSQKDRTDVGADDEAGRRLAPQTPHPPSLAKRPLRRQTPEVGAVCGNSRPYGSVRGAPSNGRPYRDTLICRAARRMLPIQRVTMPAADPSPGQELSPVSSSQVCIIRGLDLMHQDQYGACASILAERNSGGVAPKPQWAVIIALGEDRGACTADPRAWWMKTPDGHLKGELRRQV